MTILELVTELDAARRAAEESYGVKIRLEDAIEHATRERERQHVSAVTTGFRCGFSLYQGGRMSEDEPRIYVAFDGEHRAYLHADESIKDAGSVERAFAECLRHLKLKMIDTASLARAEAGELENEVEKLAGV